MSQSPLLSRRALLAATGAAALGAAAGAPALAATRPSPSPIVHRDRSVTFTLVAPSATTVEVLGGWGKWFDFDRQPMIPDGSGGWSLTIGPLQPSFYFYWFIVDGVPTKDPANHSTVLSNPAMSTFLLPGPGTEFLTEHRVPHGAVQVLDYQSEVTGTQRQAAVWTPPGYRAGHRTLPAFYLVHGGGGRHLDWIQLGRANVILDNLFAAGQLRPMVVVMPDGNVPGATALPTEDTFPAELFDNLVPAVERRYRVIRSASGRALAGLSLGGLQTWNVLLSRPGAVAYIGDFSSGYFPPVIEEITTEHADLLRDPRINRRTRLHRVYIGNQNDIAYANNVATRAMFDRFGIRYGFSLFAAGGHAWETWRDNLADFAPRLFRA